jgi:hypothetical protein
MKKFLVSLLLAVSAVFNIHAATTGVKISDYPRATTMGDNDLFVFSLWTGSAYTTNRSFTFTNLVTQLKTQFQTNGAPTTSSSVLVNGATVTNPNFSGNQFAVDGSGTNVYVKSGAGLTNSVLIAPSLGVATATSINGTTIPSSKTLVVTTDKLNVLSATTSAEFINVITDETGSGLLVFGTSPTIVTPTIASFVNSTHTHQNAAGGGTLDTASLASGTMATARLGSGTANSSTFLRGDNTWASPAGSGDVTGPASSTANEAAWFSGTGGKTLQSGSGVLTFSSTNLNAKGPIFCYSLTATNSITIGNGVTPGFLAMFDGGSRYFSISPTTLSTSLNLIPDTAPGGGFWFGTVGSTTNETITHISSTGSGNVVLATSPTIVTPTIASFVNATHNHQNAAGGGALDAAALTSGTIGTARLGSGTANSGTFLRGDSTWTAAPTPATNSNQQKIWVRIGTTNLGVFDNITLWPGSGITMTSTNGTGNTNVDVSITSSSGSGLGYTIMGGTTVNNNPSTSTTTYTGTWIGSGTDTFTNSNVKIPKGGTIKYLWVKVRVNGTQASSGNVTHKVSVNGAAGSGTGVTLTYQNSFQQGSTTEAITVAQNDFIALEMVYPASWGATPPTAVTYEFLIHIE